MDVDVDVDMDVDKHNAVMQFDVDSYVIATGAPADDLLPR